MNETEPVSAPAKKAILVVVGAFALATLYLVSVHNYLVFHSLAEIFSIVVACGIFMVSWNSRRFLKNGYFLFLGIAFVFVAFMDVIHTLAYSGMGVFPEREADLTVRLWIAARYVHCISFLIAPCFLRRPLRFHLAVVVFAAYAFVASLLLLSIFHWRIFPDCFVQGTGLTPFKKNSEYLICLILLVSIGVHLRQRGEFETRVCQLLIASITVVVASELAFTLYVRIYGLPNLVGHLLKVVSFFLIYKALIEVGLEKPYDLLFRDSKRSEEALRQEREHLAAVNQRLQYSLRQLEDDETAARNVQFHLLPEARIAQGDYEFSSYVKTSAYLSGDFVDYFLIDDSHWGFYVADVSGQGVSSAFVTVLLKSTMNYLLEEYRKADNDVILHPDHALKTINDYIAGQAVGKYLTMFYSVLDMKESTLCFSSGGQFPYPVLWDGNASRFLELKGLPVGLFDGACYRTMTLQLPSACVIAMFSDGVLETLPQGNLRSKQDFLLSLVHGKDVTVEGLLKELRLETTATLLDDITVLLVKKGTQDGRS